MRQFIARQGDVLIIACPTLPDDAVQIPREKEGSEYETFYTSSGLPILAHGEVTGHAHVVDSPDALFLAVDLDEMADRFLKVAQECQVVHDEHANIVLPPGSYVVRRQREYSPDAIRNVGD